MQQCATRWATACKLLVMGLVGVVARPAAAQTAYGLLLAIPGTPLPALATFDAATGAIRAARVINGYTTGTLVGLDVRPATGQLYTLGYDCRHMQAQVYTLKPATGNATAVGPAFALALGTGNTDTQYSRIGFDFDPITDRIRVTGGTGTSSANYRLDPGTDMLAATDTPLAYAATDPNAGQAPTVGASAYTNSYAGSTSTTLYNIDEAAGRLVMQSPANNGILNTVAGLGLSLNGDQYTDLAIQYEAATQTNMAYLLVADYAAQSTILYKLDLATGVKTQLSIMGSNGTT